MATEPAQGCQGFLQVDGGAGLEVAERLASHAQKEEMSLLPVLEDLLDETTDLKLSEAYV